MTEDHAPPSALGPWGPFTEAVTRASGHFTKSFVRANRAAAAAFGLPGSADSNGADVEPSLPGMAYEEAEWEFEGSADSADELGVGDRVVFRKRITDEDVRSFARASGDTNKLHLDDEFAADSRFGDRIAHGTLVSGLISAALARLPLMTVYLSQDLQFLHPVEIGDELTATCEVVEDLGDRKYRLATVVENEAGDTIIDGEAIVLIDDHPAIGE